VAAGRADLARISAAHPVLRSAHVVDAGGCALLVLLDALAGALAGRDEPVDVGWLAEHAAPGAADAAAADAAAADAAPAGQPARAAYEVVAVLRPADAAAVADALTRALGAVGDAVAVVPGDGVVTAHVHAAAPGDVAAALTASGAAWTATVRALLAGARDVVACTGSAAAAAAFADLGAVAVLLPGGLPAGAARDAVRRAAQDAGTGPAGAPRPVTVLPGGRLAPGDLDPAWTVPDGAVDDGTVLAALAAVPAVPSAGAEARP
jgi:dihydroxyacetone kinase-like predicted kinase